MILIRLPNGYGSVYKLSGKRRKPWAAAVTVGWDDNGKQLRKIIGTAESSPKALDILEKYHQNPYDIDNAKMTFEELYEKWFEWKKKDNDISVKTINRYTNAFKYYKSLHNKPFIDINMLMIQNIIDECEYGYATKSDIKSLYCQLYDYAKVLNLPVKNIVTKYIKIGNKEKSDLHIPFTEEEIQTLWDNINIPDVDLILINIYTGQRPSELIDPTEIHIEDKYIVSGIKTEAGIDRTIPLHDKIIPLVKIKFVDHKIDLNYRQYNHRFKKIMDLLKMNHTPHDCRHTFATLSDKCGMNKLCRKLILGHAVQDMTDGTYTHKTLEDLLEAVNLLK